MSVPPPAVSGVDSTVSVTMAVADSFDVLPDGKCAGRSDNSGIRDGARVQLRGDTVGGSVSSIAKVRFQNGPPIIYNGVNGHGLVDDGLYCIINAIFAPTRPDPDGYSIKFVGGDWRSGVRPRNKLWMYKTIDRQPGYGSFTETYQTCRSLTDPPNKDCPEWAN
jgi:hypothetical protein